MGANPMLGAVARRLQPARHLPPWAPGTALEERRALREDPLYRCEGIPPLAPVPVLLVPGFGAPRRAMSVFETWLRQLDMRPRTASTRLGLSCSEEVTAGLERELVAAAERSGERVLLLAHSRGGQFARVAAVRHPELTAGLVAVGTPWRVSRDVFHPALQLQLVAMAAAGSAGVPGLLGLGCLRGRCCAAFRADLARPLREIPFVSIYSRDDRTIRWRNCLDPDAENVEIAGSHVGMLASRASYRAVLGFLIRNLRADRSGASP